MHMRLHVLLCLYVSQKRPWRSVQWGWLVVAIIFPQIHDIWITWIWFRKSLVTPIWLMQKKIGFGGFLVLFRTSQRFVHEVHTCRMSSWGIMNLRFTSCWLSKQTSCKLKVFDWQVDLCQIWNSAAGLYISGSPLGLSIAFAPPAFPGHDCRPKRSLSAAWHWRSPVGAIVMVWLSVGLPMHAQY